jgi:hypothetical protein
MPSSYDPHARHRRRVWLSAAVPIVLGVCWMAWQSPTPFPVKAYERIQLGMTRAEVEQILRGPAGNYSGSPQPYLRGPTEALREKGIPRPSAVTPSGFVVVPSDLYWEYWYWPEHWTMVASDNHDVVIGCYLDKAYPDWRRPQTFGIACDLPSASDCPLRPVNRHVRVTPRPACRLRTEVALPRAEA